LIMKVEEERLSLGYDVIRKMESEGKSGPV